MCTPMVRVKLDPVVTNGLLLLSIVLYAVPATAFWRHLCPGELATARIDPIVSPGYPSQHAHVAFGASYFGFNPSIDDLVTSNCTSCSITEDKSAYWTPRLYFQHDNGTFEEVPTVGGMTAYYFTEVPNTGDSIIAFPKNFRMIAGNSLKRSFFGPIPDPPMSEWQASDMTQQALMEKSIGFNCLHYNWNWDEGSLTHHELRPKAFIDQNCVDGVRAELQFPSCWNGHDLDSENHTTHVAYPSQLRNGPCPDGYPVRLPTLFYETIYNTPLFSGLDGQFVFANGDPTGNGYHGDFIGGWDDGVLQQAIDNWNCTTHEPSYHSSSGLQEDCPVFRLQSPAVGTSCKAEIPEALQDEPVNFIPALPGNNPIQSGPGYATIPGQTPSATDATASAVASAATTSSVDTAGSPTTPDANSARPSTISALNAEFPTTTVFFSNGREVHLVIVEEIVTTTVAAEATTGTLAAKRHLHHHGRSGSLGRH